MQINLKQNHLFTEQLDIDARVFLEFGSRGSGKSYGVVQNVTIDCMREEKDVIVFRKVRAKVKKSIFKLFYNIITEQFGFKLGQHFNKKAGNQDIQISYKINKTVIDFDGLDDPEKAKGAEGYKIAVIEELSEFTREEFNAILAVVLRNPDSKIYAMTNPTPVIPGTEHWIKTDFLNHVPNEFGKNHIFKIEQDIDGVLKSYNVCVLKTTYKHNAFCTDAFKIWIKNLKLTNPDLYKLWGEGEYAEFKGAILNNGYDVVDDVPEGIPFLGYGLDFGSTDPMALVAVWKYERNIYMKEIIYETDLTNLTLYDRMIELGVSKSASIVADSARKDSIQELYDLGYRYIKKCHKYSGHKTDAAQYLRGCKLFVVKGSVNLMTELSTWSWETTKNGDIKPDAKPADGNDHLIDALIYRLAIKKKTRVIQGYM